jgi:two-component system, chemotaxis family, response regulator PixG
MTYLFNAVEFLRESARAAQQGRLQIQTPQLTWTLHLVGDRIRYAFHPLQKLEHLKQRIQDLYPEQLALILQVSSSPSIQPLSSNGQGGAGDSRTTATSAPKRRFSDRFSQWEHGLPLSTAVAELVQQQLLSSDQGEQILLHMTEEALESLLWVEGQVLTTWATQCELDLPEWLGPGIKLLPLLDRMGGRLQQWQRLGPEVRSPHQCPYLEDSTRLQRAAEIGVLPLATLESIARLMEGRTLEQLAGLLKLDSLKLAQLLHPYLSQGVMQLQPVQPPLDSLPLIPLANIADRAPLVNLPASLSAKAGAEQNLSVLQTPGNLEAIALPPAEESVLPKRKSYKIICIDDSPTVLETVQQYLGSEQFQVATVENPMASLSALFDMRPDLILLDVSMPGIDGNRLCNILRRSSIFTQVPIIIVSGNTGTLDKAKAKAAGATDYLAKPFSKAELLAIVEEYLQLTVV